MPIFVLAEVVQSSSVSVDTPSVQDRPLPLGDFCDNTSTFSQSVRFISAWRAESQILHMQAASITETRMCGTQRGERSIVTGNDPRELRAPAVRFGMQNSMRIICCDRKGPLLVIDLLRKQRPSLCILVPVLQSIDMKAIAHRPLFSDNVSGRERVNFVGEGDMQFFGSLNDFAAGPHMVPFYLCLVAARSSRDCLCLL